MPPFDANQGDMSVRRILVMMDRCSGFGLRPLYRGPPNLARSRCRVRGRYQPSMRREARCLHGRYLAPAQMLRRSGRWWPARHASVRSQPPGTGRNMRIVQHHHALPFHASFRRGALEVAQRIDWLVPVAFTC